MSSPSSPLMTLSGICELLRPPAPIPMPTDQHQDDVEARLDLAFLAPARKRHGTRAWDTAVREEAQSSFEDAIAYALDQQRAPSAHAASAR